jgi:hypothetical protein
MGALGGQGFENELQPASLDICGDGPVVCTDVAIRHQGPTHVPSQAMSRHMEQGMEIEERAGLRDWAG